jgi:hypothetical protein
LDFGPKISFSWAVVRQSIVVPLLVTTVSPSLATWTSVYWTPAFLQAAFSSSSIGREASEIAISPRQNFSKPSPVPAPPTVICTSGFSSLKNSLADSANGWTVLEPSMAMLPLRSVGVSASALPPPPPLSLSSLPQATAVRARAITASKAASFR